MTLTLHQLLDINHVLHVIETDAHCVVLILVIVVIFAACAHWCYHICSCAAAPPPPSSASPTIRRSFFRRLRHLRFIPLLWCLSRRRKSGVAVDQQVINAYGLPTILIVILVENA